MVNITNRTMHWHWILVKVYKGSNSLICSVCPQVAD